MEISFKDIMRIIKKNLALIIVVSLLFAAVSYCVTSLFIKKTYTSSVKLYVSANYSDNNANEDLSTYNYTSKLVTTYIEMLDTNKFYNAVSEELDGKYTPSQLANAISFTNVENTEVFMAKVVFGDPTQAKNIADAVAVVAPETISKLLVNNYQLKIVDEATVPKKPTSPNLAKNVLLAFFAGMALMLVIAFLRDCFDIKVKYEDDMSMICGLPILSVVPDFESYANSKDIIKTKRRVKKGGKHNG